MLILTVIKRHDSVKKFENSMNYLYPSQIISTSYLLCLLSSASWLLVKKLNLTCTYNKLMFMFFLRYLKIIYFYFYFYFFNMITIFKDINTHQSCINASVVLNQKIQIDKLVVFILSQTRLFLIVYLILDFISHHPTSCDNVFTYNMCH